MFERHISDEGLIYIIKKKNLSKLNNKKPKDNSKMSKGLEKRCISKDIQMVNKHVKIYYH